MAEKITSIKTLIVEDEKKSLQALELLISRYCDDIEVIATASSVAEAVDAIEQHRPEMVLLDIALPDGDGFEVLDRVSFMSFEIIFTTAYDQYALKAFEFSALHYLLKPIDHRELQRAINRYLSSRTNEDFEEKIMVLKEMFNNRIEKIVVPTTDCFEVFGLDDIVRLEASDNYTYFYTTDGREIVVSKSLATYDRMLNGMQYVRIHSKHLVNINFIKKYVRGRGGYVILSNGDHLSVSEGRRVEFLKKVKEFAISC